LSLREAGDHFEMRCPLDGEYKIGDNWSETH
jgi:DNA polymerase-1